MLAWESFLENLRKELGEETFTKWLLPLKVVHFDAGNLYLEAQNSFQIEWFEQYIRPKTRKALYNNNFRPIKIHISCLAAEPIQGKEEKKTQTPPALSPGFTLIKDPLFPEFSIDSFVWSPSHQVFASLLANLIEGKQSSLEFNPLFLHGSSCCGKTHLLQAIAKHLQEKGVKTLYIKAETFTENVIQAIRSGSMQEFRKEHRHIDLLLFDDVQYLAKKAATQEEFFHTFNTLHLQKKQIIITADGPPSSLEEIEPRLISRFEWGLTLEIPSLEKDLLMTMLEVRCKHLSFPLSQEVLYFLVDTFSSNLKTLQKALEALVLRLDHHTFSESVSVEQVKDTLQDLILSEKKHILTPRDILAYTGEFFSIQETDILSKSQTQQCVTPRQIAMFLCREELQMPFTKIGDFFKRDHSTVMTSVRSIEEKVKNQEEEFVYALAVIRQKITKRRKTLKNESFV